MKRTIRLLCLALSLLLSGCAAKTAEPTETTAWTEPGVPVTEAVATVPATEELPSEPTEERFVLTFTGDCTFGSSPSNYYAGYGFIKTVGEDYGHPFRNVLHYLEGDELTLINLEGPLTDVGNPMQKKHTFRGPTVYSKILTQNSIEAVTIANNHTFDYGEAGYASTLKTLQEAEVPYVERDSSLVLTTRNGLKVGIYGAVYYLLDVDTITAGIQNLKEQGCELIVFAPHWGTEGTYHPTEQQIEVGHAAIDAGAHIVWGSHPHVLQSIEVYNGGIIYYSLGNFSFGGNIYPRDYDTALIQQEVIRGENGIRLGELVIVPANVSSVSDRNNFQPTPYLPESEAYSRVLSKLDGSFAGPDLKIG